MWNMSFSGTKTSTIYYVMLCKIINGRVQSEIDPFSEVASEFLVTLD